MSSSLDPPSGHYPLPPSSKNGSVTISNLATATATVAPIAPSNRNSHINSSSSQYNLGYLGQQQQHQSHRHSQQQMFYSQQEYHQQNTKQQRQPQLPPPQQQQQQQQRHSNPQYSQQQHPSPSSSSPSSSQYSPTQQDISRHGHYNQHQHSLQQQQQYGQQGHYQGQSQPSRGPPPPSSSSSSSSQQQQQQQQPQPQQQPAHSQERGEQESNRTSVSVPSTPRSENGSNLRFKISLEAQTAAMQRQDETPMTYLNKGQYYNVGLKDIEDYDGEVTSVIKVTFHEPSHRRLAARYWSFWLSQQPNPKTARALDIEKASSTGMLEVQSKMFDRISFKWNGKTGAKLMVRFNCLSTDFSRIKGVKGIPLRVHVDTYLEGIGDNNKDGRGERVPMERAFAKIKLFRDKGAERKNKDDHKQLEKMWDKMRGKNADTNPLVSILAPVQSTMVFCECLDHEEAGEDETLDLSDTLTNDVAVEEGGGSPSYEVNEGEEINGGDNHNRSRSSSRLDSEGALGSPSSAGGGGGGEDLGPAAPTSKKRRRITEAGGSPASPGTNINSSNGGLYSPHQSHVSTVSSISSPNALVTTGADSGLPVTSTGQIMGRDENYVPLLPIVRKKRPVLCLYIRIGGESVYRAVYLEKYTLTDLINKLSEKLEIQSSTISCVFRKTLKKELLVRVDDAMVAQMTDELDMVVEYDFNQQDGSVNLTLKY